MNEKIIFDDTGERIALAEVSAQVARLLHIRFALDEAGMMSREDWGDGGHYAWNLAESHMDDELDGLDDFGYQTLYSLNSWVPASDRRNHQIELQNLLTDVKDDSEFMHARANQISRYAARYALARCGILVEKADETKIPPATRAAYAYQRGDITKSLDRQIYTHSDKIEKFVQNNPVPYHKTSSPHTDDGEVSLYQALSHQPQKKTITVGKFEGTPLEIWWQELDYNLDRFNESL